MRCGSGLRGSLWRSVAETGGIGRSSRPPSIPVLRVGVGDDAYRAGFPRGSTASPCGAVCEPASRCRVRPCRAGAIVSRNGGSCRRRSRSTVRASTLLFVAVAFIVIPTVLRPRCGAIGVATYVGRVVPRLGGFVDGIVLHQILQWHHMPARLGSCLPRLRSRVHRRRPGAGSRRRTHRR
jgi:hypothetical protein